MAIIYSYPLMTSTVSGEDLLLITDVSDNKKTKSIKVSALPSSGAGITLTTTGTSGPATLVGTVLNVPNYNTSGGGDTYTLQAEAKSSNSIPLKLDAAVGSDSTVNLTEGSNITLTRNSATEITIASTGSGSPDTPLNSVQFNNNSAFGGSANLIFTGSGATPDTLRVTHTLDVRGDGANAGKLKLYCENTSTPHAVTIEGPAHANAAAYTLKLPSPAPQNNQVLEYENSTNNLRWINTPSGGGGSTSPASPVNSVQFNNSSSFGGSVNFKYNSTNSTLTIGDNAVGSLPGVLELKAGPSATPSLKIQDLVNQNFVTITTAEDTSNSYTIYLPDDGPSANNKILESDASGNLTWISTPTGTTYSAGTGLALNGTTFSLATNAALTNLGGGTGSTFLRKDGSWATPQDANTNIANSNLQLDNNRTLDFRYDGADKSLTFINTNGGSKNLFKFEQTTGTAPYFYVGHSESAYEGYIVLEGNGSSRTGQVQFENAAGTYYTSIKAPNTFGANQNIVYVLPNLQGAANSVLTNNGSGTLSWAATPEFSGSGTGTGFSDATLSVEQTQTGSGNYSAIAAKVNQYQGSRYATFFYGSSEVGSIAANYTNAVSYNTSSDYRLKENVVEMTGAVERVKQLKPNRFNFISDPSDRIVDGFLAHEVSAVVPEAITGDKDEVDANGNPIYQGIDQSKLVPLLVGAIKELTARIEALEA